MTFDIREHLDRLEPDGGSNDPRGDHSFHCPVCEATNFKVNIVTGRWGSFSCDCAATEAGKRRIRDAISPAVNPDGKPPRQKQERHWDYFTLVTLERGQPALTVHRHDDPDQPDGKGWKDGRKIWQQSRIDGHQPGEVGGKVLPYRYAEAKQALDDGVPFVFWVEGEPCVDAIWRLGLPAVTSLAGTGKFRPERDGGLFPADRIVVCPDRDQPGLKHAEQVAAAYSGCQWLYPFPGTPQWNGSCPPNKGLDIADWIAAGATVEQILAGIGPKQHGQQKPVAQPPSAAKGGTVAEPTVAGFGPKNHDKDPTHLDIGLCSYGQLLDLALDAIREGLEDDEMRARAELKNRFRVSDEQIGVALFKRYSAGRIQATKRTHDSVDLSRVEALTYRLDGWIQWGDVSLTYGPYGTGKTTLAVLKAHSYAKGVNLLDRSTPCTPGKTLFIATDSGAAALKKAFSDLGIDPDEDPLLKPGGPEQAIWVWAYEPDQGHDAWICDIHGVIRLERFIREKGITYVVIDSAKSVSSAAGWSYTSNEAVKALLKFLREGLCQPFGCCIEFLSHDGSEKGSHSGAKAWAEDPSMVCALTLVKGENGEADAVKVEFRKDRAAVVDARRSLSYRLTDQAVELIPGSEVVGNCDEAILTVLWDAHQQGIDSVSTASLIDQVWARFKKSRKTVENTLGRIAGTGKGPTPTPVVRPRRGHLALSPRQLQLRSSDIGSSYRGVGEMGGVNRRATAAQGLCTPPIHPPGSGVRGFDSPPSNSSGVCIGGDQSTGLDCDLTETPPSGRMAPPSLGSSWDAGEGDDPHWPPLPSAR